MNYNKSKSFKIIYGVTIPYLILSFFCLKISANIYLLFLSVFLWLFVISITRDKEFIRSIKKKYIFLWLFFIYVLFFSYYSEGINSIKLIFTYLINIFPILLYDFYFVGLYKKEYYIKPLFLLILIIIIYLGLINLYYLNQNPMIARYLTSYNPSIDMGGFGSDLPKAIGGGFNLVYGLIFIPPCCTYIIFNLNISRKIKFINIIFMLFVLYVIYKMNFATAFLLCILACVWVYISKFFNLINTLILLGLIACFIVIFFPYLDELFMFLSSSFPEKTILNERLMQISEIFLGSEEESSIKYRLINIDKSLTTFYNHMFIGKSYQVGYDFRGEAAFIGQHNEWLDILARYGLIGGINLLGFIILSFKELIRKYKHTPFKSLINILVTLLIILGFFNPIFGTTVFVIIYIYIPCYIELIMKEVKS